MSSGECPDMYSSWSGGPMYEYIDSGFAQPIDDLLDQSDVKDKLLDAAIEQGKLQWTCICDPISECFSGRYLLQQRYV